MKQKIIHFFGGVHGLCFWWVQLNSYHIRHLVLLWMFNYWSFNSRWVSYIPKTTQQNGGWKKSRCSFSSSSFISMWTIFRFHIIYLVFKGFFFDFLCSPPILSPKPHPKWLEVFYPPKSPYCDLPVTLLANASGAADPSRVKHVTWDRRVQPTEWGFWDTWKTYGCWTKNMGKPPKSSHLNKVFHYKPSILGVFPLFLVQHPYCWWLKSG